MDYRRILPDIIVSSATNDDGPDEKISIEKYYSYSQPKCKCLFLHCFESYLPDVAILILLFKLFGVFELDGFLLLLLL